MDYGLILWLCLGLLARFLFLSGNSPCPVATGRAVLLDMVWLLVVVLWGWSFGGDVWGVTMNLFVSVDFFLFLLMVLCSFAGLCWFLVRKCIMRYG